MSRAVTLGRATSGSVGLAIVLIGLGLLAMAVPVFASIGAIKVLAWLIVFDGITQLVHAFRSAGIGRMAWKVLVGFVYVGAGLWLLFHSVLGLTGLTFMLAVFFLAEGIMDITAYFFTPKSGRSVWMLLNGALEALALRFLVGGRNTTGNQHAYDGHYSADDGASRSQKCAG